MLNSIFIFQGVEWERKHVRCEVKCSNAKHWSTLHQAETSTMECRWYMHLLRSVWLSWWVMGICYCQAL